jgi:hypothetical protein
VFDRPSRDRSGVKILGVFLFTVGAALIFVSWSAGALGWPHLGFEEAVYLIPARPLGIGLVGTGALMTLMGLVAAPKEHDRHDENAD